MSDNRTVVLDIDDGIATVTLNRAGAGNALNRELRLELRSTLEEIERNEAVRAVVLAGAGRNFCAGADLMERDPDAGRDGYVTDLIKEEYAPIIRAIRDSAKPYVAAVNGSAAGIGVSIALACDVVVMAGDAALYSAFGKISLIPDGGAHKLLLERLGGKKAFEMIALSQRLDAAQCVDLGLANQVVRVESLADDARSLAQRLAAAAPLTVRYCKQVLHAAECLDLEATIQLEAETQNLLFRSRDFREGAQAFMEKRKPVFEGH